MRIASSASTSPSSSSSSLHTQPQRISNSSQKLARRRMSKEFTQFKSGYPLQRGSACLSCRKRKMKCDAGKPSCGQCIKANRGGDCDYDDGKSKSRTQLLQEKIATLESRIRELKDSPDTITRSGSAPQLHRFSSASGNPHVYNDVMFGDSGPFDHLVPMSTTGSPSPDSSSGSAWMGDQFDLQVSRVHSPDALRWDVDPLTPLSPEDLLKVSGRWWEAEEPPQRIRQLLLDIFLPHRHQCGFEVDIARFQLSLASASDAPHPALLNAMYALACHFSLSPALTPHEPRFIARALRAISDALEGSDRLVHVLHASCLLAVLFFAKGRLLEGYYHTGAAARLALGLGLHQISSPEWSSPGASPASSSGSRAPSGGAVAASGAGANPSILPPPVDSVEFGERILAFWQVFNLDRCWAVATGMPVALSDDNHPRTRIETVWPRSLEEYGLGRMGEHDYSTVHLLYSQVMNAPQAFSRQDSTNALRAKATTLFERAARLSSSFGSTAQTAEQFWLDFQIVDAAIARLSSTLPPARRADAPTADSPTSGTSRVDHGLFVVHVLLHAATIQLHSPFALKDAASQQKSVTVASLATLMLHELDVEDYAFLDPIMGTCWTSVAEALVRELLVCGADGVGIEQVNALNRQLDMVVLAMNRLGATVPLAAYQASKVEESRVISF